MARKTNEAPQEPRTGLQVVAYESKDAPAAYRWIAFVCRFGLPDDEGREQFSRNLVHAIGPTEEGVRRKAKEFIDRETEKAARRKAATEASAKRLREMQRSRKERELEDA